jgi:hypothetical protein
MLIQMTNLRQRKRKVMRVIESSKTLGLQKCHGPDGEYHSVKCILCTEVTGREKLLAPKWDTIQKHAGRRKTKKDLPHLGIKKGEFHVSEDCKHATNARLYKG